MSEFTDAMDEVFGTLKEMQSDMAEAVEPLCDIHTETSGGED